MLRLGTINHTAVAAPARTNLAPALLCLAPFVCVLDVSIVTIALPAMRRDLDFSASGVQWVFNSYVLAIGGFLLLGGRLADALGRRRLFLAGRALFAFASLAASLAMTPWMLVAARALQGIGAAAMTPASLSLVTVHFSDPVRRDRAVGLYGAMVGVGFVAGIVLGGAITETLGWRWVFFVNVPLLLAAIPLVRLVVPESRDPATPRGWDIPGVATATLGVTALIYALSTAAERGWTATPTAVTGVVGVILLGAFALIERRGAAPLLPAAVLKVRAVAVADLALLLQSTVGMAQLYVLTLCFQEVLGRSAFDTALLFLPMALVSAPAAATAGRLVPRLGVRTTAALGLTFLTAGLLLMTTMDVRGGPLVVLIGMAIGEAGFMLANVPLTIAATTRVPRAHRGLAAGLLGTSIEIGHALGLGVVAAVISAYTGTLDGATDPAELARGLRAALFVGAGSILLTLLVVLVTLRDGARHR